jgi:hypothetical protein
MRHKKMLAGIVTVGALAIPATPAAAISSADACAADGGTYVKDGSTAQCVYPVGNSHNTKTTDQKGSFNSSHEEGYENPNGNRPPGQQGGDTLP